jgi:hypothetical protein
MHARMTIDCKEALHLSIPKYGSAPSLQRPGRPPSSSTKQFKPLADVPHPMQNAMTKTSQCTATSD